ncbi:MAG: fibronectin type III domain-containing protein [Porticoccaceae bacterium]|nr:fibronectin type III domain-containing protein [Porticoccaceae bacterium]
MRLVAGLCALLLSLGSTAATVTASWDRPQTNTDGSPAVIDGYRISYQCQTKQGTAPATAEQTSRQLDVPDGEQCSASMVAYNAAGDSQRSNVVQFSTPPLERPGAVRNLRISWSERGREPDMPRWIDYVELTPPAYGSWQTIDVSPYLSGPNPAAVTVCIRHTAVTTTRHTAAVRKYGQTTGLGNRNLEAGHNVCTTLGVDEQGRIEASFGAAEIRMFLVMEWGAEHIEVPTSPSRLCRLRGT